MSEKELSRLVILGAGASVDCGLYPTGVQLVEIVRKILQHPSALKESQIPQEPLRKLVEANAPSIDAYISSINGDKDRTQLKALIISVLRVCADYSETYSSKFTNSWYFSIWQLFENELRNCNTDEQKLEKLQQIKSFKIITFNYDPSLELFLWKRIDVNFYDDLSKRRAIEIIAGQIFHVYGDIGNILNLRGYYSCDGDLGFGKFDETQESVASCWREILPAHKKDGGITLKIIHLLGKALKQIDAEKINASVPRLADQQVVTKLVEGIQVIDKERNHDPKIDEITKRQDGWDVVYILGYGFDRLNNKSLRLNEIVWNKGCFVTNFGGKVKLEKRIYEQLSRGNGSVSMREQWKIPTMITDKSVAESLADHFDLFEIPEKPRCINTSVKGMEPFDFFELQKKRFG